MGNRSDSDSWNSMKMKSNSMAKLSRAWNGMITEYYNGKNRREQKNRRQQKQPKHVCRDPHTAGFWHPVLVKTMQRKYQRIPRLNIPRHVVDFHPQIH